MSEDDWLCVQWQILALAEEGLATPTFRRLDTARQRAVLNAILDEAADWGPAALNIKRVAERAGVSVGSLYTYFNNRAGLLDFAIEITVRLLLDGLDRFQPFLAALPLREGLSAYLTGGVEWSQTLASVTRFFARAAYHGDPELLDRVVPPVADKMLAVIRAMLQSALERGELRPDVDLEATARILHGLTIVVGDSQLLPYLNTYFAINASEVPPGRTLDALLVLILAGIGGDVE